MRVCVQFRLPDGQTCRVGHGAIIGRLNTADLHLQDARVSEAHALVSLRGRDVHLLALRGRFVVGGRTRADVVLEPGMSIDFARGLAVLVESIHMPERVMALRGAHGVAVLLGVTSLFAGPELKIVRGWKADADDVLWPDGAGWMRSGSIPVVFGDRFQVGEHTVEAVGEPIESASATIRSPEFSQPIRLIARFDTVHLMREGQPTVVLSGIIARILTELVQSGAPLGWEMLARQIWGDSERLRLRRRWDMQMMRLRRRLRDQGLRDDLIRADGSGLVELVLGANDRVVDES